MLPAIILALWIGILTAISPCPLSLNLAAISYISSRGGRGVAPQRVTGKPGRVLLAGLAYTLGQMAVYIGLSTLLVGGVLAVPRASQWLQGGFNKLLGPLLVLTGMFLLDLIPIRFGLGGWASRLQGRVEKLGLLGALLLGAVFSLSFCPVSAALFFSQLISLALKHHSPLLLPAAYGVGAALPVLFFAILLAGSMRVLSPVYRRITQFEFWARRLTGLLFIVVGIYYSLIYIFRVG